jgi:hypothetical protein
MANTITINRTRLRFESMDAFELEQTCTRDGRENRLHPDLPQVLHERGRRNLAGEGVTR